MDKRSKRGPSQTRQVFDALRSAIVEGRLLPGAKLNIAAFAEEIEVSAGAVREALAMLEAESLVVSEPARGYRVSPVSANDLRQLVQARIEIERLCLAEAIRKGDLAWEGGIVSAFHRLSRVPDREDGAPEQLNRQWAAFHADFHRALLAACPNQWLLRMHEMLYQQSERYRQLTVPLAGGAPRDALSEHRHLMHAVLERDVQTAQALIAEHLQMTATLLLASADGLNLDAREVPA